MSANKAETGTQQATIGSAFPGGPAPVIGSVCLATGVSSGPQVKVGSVCIGEWPFYRPKPEPEDHDEPEESAAAGASEPARTQQQSKGSP